MSTQMDDMFYKVCRLIEKRKNELSDDKPIVHTFDDGAYLHYFSSWGDYYGGSLKKQIKPVGEYPKNRNVVMVFAKKGIHIPLTSFPCSKTYIVIRGKIDFTLENEEIRELDSFSTMMVKKNVPHGGIVREDSFIVIYEEDID